MTSPDKIHPDCRAKRPTRVVTDMFAVCLTDVATCPHRVKMEEQCLCFHPLRQGIVTQTDSLGYKNMARPNPDRPAASAG